MRRVAFDLEKLGEFGLIEAVRRRAGGAGRIWPRTIGDDAALLRPRAGREIAVTTDALIEHVHFRWTTTDARSLGHKALAVNVSDLGAMGAEPLGFVLCLGLPRDVDPVQVRSFLVGLLAEARSSGCPLVGGDTVSAACWTLAVTALGDLPRGTALGRGGARPGDRLVVTGDLGGAAFGLELLERGADGERWAGPFLRRHRRPRPPFRAGPRLRRCATAAIDLSDGLAQDLGHLLRESGVGADVDLDRVPIPRAMRARCAQLGLDAERLALHGGEDYELLFTLPADGPATSVLARRLGCRLTELGLVRAGRGARYLRDGAPVSVPARGYDHFKRAADPTET